MLILIAACQPEAPIVAPEPSTSSSVRTESPAPTDSPTPAIPPGAVAWLQANAVPFDSLGSGCDDVQPLMESLGERRIVGLGEAAHGTYEFHLFKARLVECQGFLKVILPGIAPEKLSRMPRIFE